MFLSKPSVIAVLSGLIWGTVAYGLLSNESLGDEFLTSVGCLYPQPSGWCVSLLLFLLDILPKALVTNFLVYPYALFFFWVTCIIFRDSRFLSPASFRE